MNYAQLVELFNQYLADESATSFASFLAGRDLPRTSRKTKLDVSKVQTGGRTGNNAKYAEFLEYIEEHNIDISGKKAKKDIQKLYGQLHAKDAWLNSR